MMNKKKISKLTLLLVTVAALFTVFAVKPYYGGEVTLRLNEPDDFTYTPASYSNLIFYSLLYENLFYLTQDGDIKTNIFQEFRYDKQSRTLNLVLKKNASYSDGSPITANSVKLSLLLFLDRNLSSSRKLRQMIKQIQILPTERRIILELQYDEPAIITALTAPELVLTSEKDQVFSGMFFPVEWVKNQYIILKPNPYYPGGRSYLDSIKVVFYDFYYPDVFLSEPGITGATFNELQAGVYQNIYLAFPGGKVGKNSRIALFSLLKEFYTSSRKKSGQSQSPESSETEDTEKPKTNVDSISNLVELNALTSNEESPVTLNIQTFSRRRVRSILRYSKVKLYALSSMRKMEEPFAQFLEKKGVPIETIFISDSQLINFMNNTSVKFLLLSKTFNRRIPMEEKIKVLLKEMSFSHFNEDYLKLINQLDEMKFLKDNELTMDLVARIIEKIMSDGFLLPIGQRQYSIYVKEHVKGIKLDYYGKPLFQATRVR
jgi:MarR-like DNA-binding transcriptional regulator SgrR of sgrS sRNA